MIQGLYFGAILNYQSSIDGHLTRCVYIREENEKAIVMFAHAERVARVDFKQLKWVDEREAYLEDLQKYANTLKNRKENNNGYFD